jgi:SAM-dependent methyltransferase
MGLTVSSAVSLLYGGFRSLPVADRIHILGRFLTCPFLRVLPHVPAGSSVLDLGAGHGLFAALALESGVHSVVALEPDLRKVCLSGSVVPARWVAGYDPAIRASFDVVTMFDVLYRIPLGERDSLFLRLHERVRPGGRILIKELDPSRPIKFGWNRTQEWISDRFLRLTLGNAFTYEPREAVEERLARAGFDGFLAIEIDHWYPHSHILYVANRPE